MRQLKRTIILVAMMLGGIVAGMSAVAPKNFNEAVVPLAGDIVPGYADVTGGAPPPATPLRASPPVVRPAPPAPVAPLARMATARVAPASPQWKRLAIVAGIGFVVILGVLLAVLLR